MHLWAVEFFDRIDSTETIQYSVRGRGIGLLQEGYTITVNNDHIGDMLRAHLGVVIGIFSCRRIEYVGTVCPYCLFFVVVINEPCIYRWNVGPSRDDTSVSVAFQGLQQDTSRVDMPQLWETQN
ncbi:hypothetical protein TRAPUB_593 [Trametes pubescens]|uniref:Uncharacterized protein n=1 Tax=Trametes pubescens TaxID=154538 RepID=A0A1M2VLN7_TRAPU|nr:hypothetical protein TRAPUB_593 [Trametes pubescens]